MRLLSSPSQVLDAVQQAKNGASHFCTNVFPPPAKLQDWIGHGELFGEVREGAAFFLRRERDFWRLFFCAADPEVLRRELAALPCLRQKPLVTDVVGAPTVLQGQVAILESAGFRSYRRLQRLTRPAQAGPSEAAAEDTEVLPAAPAERDAILRLLEDSFDPYSDQLPTPAEIEAAIASGQMLVRRAAGTVGALLFYETQGLTSSIRYWAVAQPFRSCRYGSALMRRYLSTQPSARRFLLWVAADNENALEKYRHFGYGPDGLLDRVLVNELIPL